MFENVVASISYHIYAKRMNKAERSVANTGIYSNNFSEVFSNLLEKSGVTCFQIHKFTKLDQGYLSCLRNGKKRKPSPETIMKICLGLVHCSDKIKITEIEKLLRSVGHSLHIHIFEDF